MGNPTGKTGGAENEGMERMPLQRIAGPNASYITGETLHVNGGMYMP